MPDNSDYILDLQKPTQYSLRPQRTQRRKQAIEKWVVWAIKMFHIEPMETTCTGQFSQQLRELLAASLRKYHVKEN